MLKKTQDNTTHPVLLQHAYDAIRRVRLGAEVDEGRLLAQQLRHQLSYHHERGHMHAGGGRRQNHEDALKEVAETQVEGLLRWTSLCQGWGSASELCDATTMYCDY